MKKYFVYIDGNQSESLSIEELKKLSIDKNTLVWYKGLKNWERAGNLNELDELWIGFEDNQNEIEINPNNYTNRWFLGIGLTVILGIIGWYYLKPTDENLNKPVSKISINKPSDSLEKKEVKKVEVGCFHTDLSESFDYRIIHNVNKIIDDGVEKNLFKITVKIYDKGVDNESDIINFTSSDLYSDSFKTCEMVRSFSTGKNKNNDVLDSDWGDFIVADFNFDKRDDFAIKAATYNAGITYDFYIQDKQGKFIKDSEHIGIEYRLNLKTY